MHWHIGTHGVLFRSGLARQSKAATVCGYGQRCTRNIRLSTCTLLAGMKSFTIPVAVLQVRSTPASRMFFCLQLLQYLHWTSVCHYQDTVIAVFVIASGSYMSATPACAMPCQCSVQMKNLPIKAVHQATARGAVTAVSNQAGDGTIR